jgi:hypothetical protein
VSRLACAVGEDGTLTNCTVNGKASADEEAAMRALVGGLYAEPETSDGVSIRSGLVVVPFDWKRLLFVTKPATSGK